MPSNPLSGGAAPTETHRQGRPRTLRASGRPAADDLIGKLIINFVMVVSQFFLPITTPVLWSRTQQGLQLPAVRSSSSLLIIQCNRFSGIKKYFLKCWYQVTSEKRLFSWGEYNKIDVLSQDKTIDENSR